MSATASHPKILAPQKESRETHDRPKGSRNVATVFAKMLREKVVLNEHGQRKTITKLEAAVKR